MLKRITNFSKEENQIIDWETNIPQVRKLKTYKSDQFLKESVKKDIDTLLNQLYLLLEKYPDALKDETILANYQKLKEYATNKNLSLKNCYSYTNRVKIKTFLNRDTSRCIYGIRITPDNSHFCNDSIITITSYNSITTGEIFSKDELLLRLNRGKLSYIKKTECDSGSNMVDSAKTLTYLKPTICK